MEEFIPQEFIYRLRWRTRGVQPGGHPTRLPGGGLDFRGFVPFLDRPDARRIDLRASLRAVPKQYVVRSFYERGAVTVYALVDVSTSMRFTGQADKPRLVADMVASIAWSAIRGGDSFAMLACSDVVHHELTMRPSGRPTTARDARAKLLDSLALHASRPNLPMGATALPSAAELMGSRRALIFLISDFHLDDALIQRTLQSVEMHDVVPVVLWDTAEYENVPQWGWAHVKDMETGGERALFLRKKVVQDIRDGYRQRRASLQAVCRKHGLREPFFVQNGFDARQLTRHLLEGNP